MYGSGTPSISLSSVSWTETIAGWLSEAADWAFSAEPGLVGRDMREIGAECFDRHGAAEAGVMREVDLRHAPVPEHLAQLIPAAKVPRLFHAYPVGQ